MVHGVSRQPAVLLGKLLPVRLIERLETVKRIKEQKVTPLSFSHEEVFVLIEVSDQRSIDEKEVIRHP